MKDGGNELTSVAIKRCVSTYHMKIFIYIEYPYLNFIEKIWIFCFVGLFFLIHSIGRRCRIRIAYELGGKNKLRSRMFQSDHSVSLGYRTGIGRLWILG